MSESPVLLEERAGALWVIFNRPEQLNPWTEAVDAALNTAADRARDTEPVALVITGRGRAFSAGADLPWLRRTLDSGDTTELTNILARGVATVRKIEELPIPVIVGINGLCVAGGMELTCAADLVVAAESAKITDGHCNYGLQPICGTAQRLVKRVGLSNAKRLLFTGEFVSAEEALRMGLVNWVVPDSELDAELERLCHSLYAKSPLVLKNLKILANLGAESSAEVGMELERALGIPHVGSDTVREGLSAFVEKRTPVFRHEHAEP